MSLNFNLRDRPNCKDVRAAIDIEVVVGRYLPSGRRKGKEWVARNPTRHDAKLGSFKVHLTHGYWSDFATNESGGDMIDLVVYLTGKTITEAKDELAAMFGVQGAQWSDSLTGNIRQPRDEDEVPKKEKKNKEAKEAVAATPAEAATAPSSFPLWTPPDEDGKPRLYPNRDDGPTTAGRGMPTRWFDEKRRHFYCQGGVRIRAKIMMEDGGALNVYRVVDPEGQVGWQFRGPADYKEVPYLSTGPILTLVDTPLFWTEGEKDADSVVERGGLAFTFGGTGDGLPQGCEQFAVGRHVVILADNDEPGRKHADDKAALAAKVAASVKIIHFPELDEKGDVSDWFERGHTFDELKALVETAEYWKKPEEAQPGQQQPDPPEPEQTPPPSKLPYGYGFSDRGLMWKDPDNADKPAMHVAGCFDIEAMTRNGDGNSWGLLLRWKDQDGRDHRFALAHELLAGDGLDARRVLTSQGFYIAPNPSARSKFNAFLLQVTSPNRALATESVGWNGSAFVLPDECFGGNAGETLLLQNATSHEHSFKQSGTLEECRRCRLHDGQWRRQGPQPHRWFGT